MIQRSMLSLILSMVMVALLAQSPDYSNWKVFSEIDYKKDFDEYGEIFVPVFNEKMRKLEGTVIDLPGYIIPFEGMFEPDKIIVSSLPIASCFFCGSGGPETVAKAFLDEEIKYTAKPVTVTGTLELNDSDATELMFILRNAKVSVR